MVEFFISYVKFYHKIRITGSFESVILICFYRGVISQPLFCCKNNLYPFSIQYIWIQLWAMVKIKTPPNKPAIAATGIAGRL
jgi:hypothetical protein